MKKLTNSLVAFSLKNPVIVFFLVGLMAAAGIYSYVHTSIEAYPDVTNTRVQVITQWPGRSAEEIEKFVTLPITREMNTIPKKDKIRSISLFGLSVVTVTFDDHVDDFYAQQYAANRLQNADLPEEADPEIDPPYGATGEIFRYIIESERPIKEITALQDWQIRPELLSVAGVSDVQTFGGEEKVYQIQVNPAALEQYDLSPLAVYEAISKSNINVGGDMIQKGDQAYVVRGVGLLTSVTDIENTLVTTRGGVPILVKNIAKVEVTGKPRLGQVSFNENPDVVQGIIVMLRGENPGEVIDRLKEKIADLNGRVLPKDVHIKPIIDRTDLVSATVKTVTHNLLEGILLVSLIVLLFLFNWRTTLIVAIIIPLSFLFAILMLKIQGMPANLISMGALDFGLLLEGTLVIVETVYVILATKSRELGAASYSKLAKGGLIRRSIERVAPSIFFAQLILIVALLPIFLFQKVEGKMFSPLAYTLGYAILGALILSLTLVPALCRVVLNKHLKPRRNPISEISRKGTFWLFRKAMDYKRISIGIFILILVLCGVKMWHYGSQFIPELDEGAVYIRATLPSSVSLEESVKKGREIKEKLRSFPQVEFVLNQTGRPNDGTDPTGFFNNEFHVQLKPEKEWNKTISKEALIDQMKDSLEAFRGITFGFSQPIQDNVEEYVSGVKSSLVVKIFGDDLYQMEQQAEEVAEALSHVDKITDLHVYKNIGLPELNIHLKEDRMARYGVSTDDAQAVIEMAIGGKRASFFHEGERKFDIQIRFAKRYRDSEKEIQNILIPTQTGIKVPLKEIADIDFQTGPAFIYREGSSRYTSVGFSIEGSDMGSVIDAAQKAVGEQVHFPEGTKVEWAGEFESKERATRQLAYVVPAVLLLILFLLYIHFGNVRDTLVSISTLSFAFIGGFLSLWVTGTVFGISAGIGFIILFGVVTINGIILVKEMKDNLYHLPLREAVSEGIYNRIRPIIMIALMDSLGLLPAALSTGMGSQIQKPLAIMIVGGLPIALILSFTVLPVIFYGVYKKQKVKRI